MSLSSVDARKEIGKTLFCHVENIGFQVGDGCSWGFLVGCAYDALLLRFFVMPFLFPL